MQTDDDTTTGRAAAAAPVTTRLRIDPSSAVPELGMACQRLIPWAESPQEPPLGAIACFLEPGGSTHPDCHDQEEVMLILSGSGIVDLAGDRGEIGAGDLVALPRNREHVVHNPSAERLTWVSIYWPLREPALEAGA